MPASELKKRDQFIVVHASHDDGVDLQPGEEGRSFRDAFQDPGEFVSPSERFEPLPIEGIQTDRQAMEPGGLQFGSGWGQRDAVRGHRKVVKIWLRGQLCDERRDATTQERLTAGEADLVDAQRQKQIDEAIDLLELQDVLAGKPDVLRFGHAVAAAEIAAIGHRQPEIAERAVECVEQHRMTLDH